MEISCPIQQIQAQSLNLSELPEEVLLTIFSHLSFRSLAKIARVSKLLKRISYDASLWKSIRFENEKLPAGTLGFVLARGTKKLYLDNCKFEEPFFADAELGEFDLEHLTFSDGRGHLREKRYGVKSLPCIRTLLLVLRSCPHLTSFELMADSMVMGDDFYQEVAMKRNLQILNLRSDIKFCTALLIATVCQRLRSWVYIGREILMTDSEINLFIEKLSPSIETMHIFKFNHSMRDEHILKLVRKCPNIRELHLQCCNHLTSEAIEHLSSLENLQYLNISRCTLISPIALCELRRVKSLKHLVAFDVKSSDQDVVKLQSTLPHVKITAFTLPMELADYVALINDQ